jgi:hypothetical protein
LEISFFRQFRGKGVGIKRPVWLGILLLLFLPVLTCKNFAPGSYSHEDPNGVTYTDVVYSPDGKSVTIYIDGTTVPVTNRQSRALSRQLAIAGHDYFEVAFIADPTGPNEVVARASWELKKDAHVEGVARGVNYDYVSTTIPGTSNPIPSGHGAAILFVGKKTDKTLLGIGKLTGTDDGGPGATTINPDIRGSTGNLLVQGTRAVTFEVDALECGVVGERYGELPNSSFLTSFGATAPTPPDYGISNTSTEGGGFGLVRDYQIDGKGFSLFKLRENGLTYASYKFFTASKVDLNTAYSQGIVLAGEGSYGKKQPRYPTGGFQWNAALRLDDRTKVTPVVNNLAWGAGQTFVNPVMVEFDTRSVLGVKEATISGSMFGFVFEIPVYPLSGAPAANNTAAGMWYIRASYDSYWQNLDDGKTSGAGGAVLIGTGNTPNFSHYKVVLIHPPTKYRYGFIQPGNIPNFQFLIDGLEVEMQTDSTPPSKIMTINNDELTFFIGGYEYFPGQQISQDMYGLQVVVVRYTDPYTNIVHEVTFPIICSGGNPTRDFTNISLANTVYVEKGGSVSWLSGWLSSADFFNKGDNSGTFLIIFNDPTDLGAININAAADGGSFLIFIMAGGTEQDPENYPGVYTSNEVILGTSTATSTGGGTVFTDQSRRHGFYFGTWPFDEDIEVRIFRGGITTETTYINSSNTFPFIINAGGSVSEVTGANFNVTPPTATSVVVKNEPDPDDLYNQPYFIKGGNNGRVSNVHYEEAKIRVYNEDWLH